MAPRTIIITIDDKHVEIDAPSLFKDDKWVEEHWREIYDSSPTALKPMTENNNETFWRHQAEGMTKDAIKHFIETHGRAPTGKDVV